MSAIIHVTDQTFDAEAIGTSVPVLLDFTAAWCGPCKALLPALEDVATAFEGRARIVRSISTSRPRWPPAMACRACRL